METDYWLSETSTTEKQMWTALWKLKVVPKVWVFWWRVLRGILPDALTLKYRHIKETGRCEICQAMDEDLMHALIACCHAKKFWVAAKDRFDISIPRLRPETWARDILMDPIFCDEDRCKIITIMHTIWTSRNRWTHDSDGYDPVQAIKWVHETLSILELPSDPKKLLAGQCWRPPDPGWVKISTDGAVDSDAFKGGAGGVARSHLAYLGAWCKPLCGVTDPFTAELLPFKEGIIFAQLRGFSHVIMEVDCLELVNLWLSRSTTRSVAAPIFKELGDIVRQFVSFSVTHVRRTSNEPAHWCARRACTIDGTDSWLDKSPDFLVNCLLADCNRLLVN